MKNNQKYTDKDGKPVPRVEKYIDKKGRPVTREYHLFSDISLLSCQHSYDG